MGTLYGVLIGIFILIAHHFLSRRNNPYWGGIVPGIYLVFMMWLFFIKNVEFEFRFVLGFLFLVSFWGDGRMRVKQKRKKELERIAIKDL